MGDSVTGDENSELKNESMEHAGVASGKGARPKDIVHKCPSDPGKVNQSKSIDNILPIQSPDVVAAISSANLCPSRLGRYLSGATTRKCVLTLDGYSYVIVASSPENKTSGKEDAFVIADRPPIDTLRSKSSSSITQTTLSSTVLQSTSSQSSSPLNGQVSKPGSLTIVRRSNSRKFIQPTTPTEPISPLQLTEEQFKQLETDNKTTINNLDYFKIRNFNDKIQSSDCQTMTSDKNDPSSFQLSSPPPPISSNQPLSFFSQSLLSDNIDLATDNLPAVDTPDACDKAALRLRCLLRLLQRGEISAEILQKNLHYAARVLEAVFIDETNQNVTNKKPSTTEEKTSAQPSSSSTAGNELLKVKRRLADEDDELSEVQPDAVPPEVREWLASTFTRQLGTTRKKSDEKPKFRSVAHAIRAGIFVDRIYRRVSSSALMQFPPDVVKVLKTLDDWSFDVFALSDAANGQPIKYLGYDLLNRYGIIHKFKVPPVTLETFLVKIEEGYCRFRNPYHNNLHAADVAQTVHHVLCQTGLMHWMSDLEIFATLLAALIHDYEHTGTTNNFHVMSGSDTAMLYNDRAVLENHHISAAFRVLKEDDCNVLSNLSREEYRELRTLIIDMVLATDMSYHFQQLKNMKNLLSLAEPAVDKSKALALVLHCCDISHPAKKWAVHHRWTMLLLEEFFRQGDLERDLGLPFSPLCDRNNTLVAESQIGFIDFIVEPSMAVCSDMLESILAPIAPITCKNSASNDDSSNTSTSILSGKVETISEEPVSSAKTDVTTVSSDSKSPSRTVSATGTISSGNNDGARFRIRKPWINCLMENKKIWKEHAIKDAEARAAITDADNEELEVQDDCEVKEPDND